MALTLSSFTINGGTGVLTFYYTGSPAPVAGNSIIVAVDAPNGYLSGTYTVVSAGGGIIDTAWFTVAIVHGGAEGRITGSAQVESAPAPGPIDNGPQPEPTPEGSPLDIVEDTGEKMSSSVNASLGLIEVCFPDITGKVIRGWGQVVITAGGYVTGGLAMGLIAWLDGRTVDFNGFLRCDVWDEEVQLNGLYRYHYNPVTDTLQIFTPAGDR